MDTVITAFEYASGLYIRYFSDFLHVHYLIRTVFLLFVIWLVIIVAMKLFKYIVGPSMLLFLYHVLFRFYNYLVVETVAEWIYITYYSKDIPRFEKAYYSLTRKARANREFLVELDYGMAVAKVKGFEKRVAYFLLTTTTLWIMAFGLYLEFFPPPPEIRPNGAADSTAAAPGGDLQVDYPPYGNEDETYYDAYRHPGYAPGGVNPAEWGDRPVILVLNAEGRNGAWLRSGPGISGFVVTQVLWGEVRLVYENFFVADEYVRGLYWLRVSTPNGNTGYLSSSLVEVYG